MRTQGGPPQRPLHRAGIASARRSIRTGRTRRACRSAAFIFGGRRATTVPLVYQAFNWNFGVYLARHHGLGNHGRRRRRSRPGAPRSRSPCCPSAATTWATTSTTGSRSAAASPIPPRIFCVNWFRKDADGKFLWPGFGENMRVLKWIVERVHGRASGTESPLGWMPRYEDLRLDRARLLRESLQRPDGGRPRSSGRPRLLCARGAVREALRPVAQGVHVRCAS